MEGKHPDKRRKRLECQANAPLTNATHEFMAAQGIETEGKAVERLLREGLAGYGHLPTKK